MTPPRSRPVRLGVAYYPEQWPEERWPIDARMMADAGIGVVAAPNFSLGVALFQSLAEQAAKMFAPYPEYGSWIHEIHHVAKKDAPSGTAIALESGMVKAGYRHPINMASAGPGRCPARTQLASTVRMKRLR